MRAFASLEQLDECARADDRALFLRRGRVIDWRTLRADVAALRREIEAAGAGDWALFHDEAYPFTVALLAVLGAGRRAWLPANATHGTEQKLAGYCDAWLGPEWSRGHGIPVETDATPEPIAALTGRIVVFTSGSTGEPQAIPKELAQLDREVASLESLWGPALGDAHVLATVSHQHIYGLLFRVLWPLCAGRPSRSERFVEVADLLAAVADTQRAAWVSSPAHLRRLQGDLPWARVRDHLAAVFSSGGPLPAETAAAFADLARLWPTEIYGSSESGGIAWRTQASGNAWWQPLPDVAVRAGEGGALELRSPHLADARWMTMSDAVEVAADGRFRLGERLDRIVKVEGKRLSLAELEGALAAHPWIAEARALLLKRRRESVAVVAVPTPQGRERLEAVGRHTFSRRLRESLLATFDPVTLPRLWRFLEALPADAQGKVGDRELAALFERPAPRRLPDTIAVEDGDRTCEIRLRVPDDLGCLAGHFPGLPVVPGVALVGWVEHFARRHLGMTGAVRDLERMKFSRLLRPGPELVLTLTQDDVRRAIGYRFRSATGGTDYASGRLVFTEPDTT